ncbi:unnamed protein product [Ilex paraguariensis]|uniref:Uncharacterized protein n=1 Tax=Ilex paraguariensis TaxID=185542 RepID=A0ABC8TQA5_9AQUA
MKFKEEANMRTAGLELEQGTGWNFSPRLSSVHCADDPFHRSIFQRGLLFFYEMLGRHQGMGRELRLFDPGAMQERYRYGNSKPSAYEHIFLQDITGKWTIVAAASAANLSTVLSCERIEALYQGWSDDYSKD